MKDCECLRGAKDTDDFKKESVGPWANNEYSVCKIRLSDFVKRDAVFDGM